LPLNTDNVDLRNYKTKTIMYNTTVKCVWFSYLCPHDYKEWCYNILS